MEEVKDVILDKSRLVKYLAGKHWLEKNKEISPVMLHKGLFILYTQWVIYHSMGENQEAEMSVIPHSLGGRLFEPAFHAWAYGPADKGIHTTFKWYLANKMTKSECYEFEEGLHETVKDFLDNIVLRLFDTGVYSLIGLTQQSDTWREVASSHKESSTGEMSEEAIVKEYKNKRELI